MNIVRNRLLHRSQVPSAQEAPLNSSSHPTTVQPYTSTNNPDASPTPPLPLKGSTSLDPFISHNEKRRQELLTSKYSQHFLRQAGTPAPGLCASCAQLNFAALSKHHEMKGEAFVLQDLGAINNSWAQRTCGFCIFLAALWKRHQFFLRSARLCLVVISSSHLAQFSGSVDKNGKGGGYGYRNVLLLSHPQPERVFEVDLPTLINLDVLGVVSVLPREREVRGEGEGVGVRAVDAERVDFRSVRGWLELCGEKHGESCFGSEDLRIPGFRLLDCETRQLERFKEGMKYVALSYIWGMEVEEQKLQNIEEGLPQTIEDAVTATLELGLKYLWVDRLCIPPDTSIKQSHTANMDQIFGCAALTIIAASGRSSTSGLCGISRKRVPQPRVTIGEFDLISTHPNPVREVRESGWYTRAWTLQEALLSKRRLFFTESQVYFECTRTTALESISKPDETFTQPKPEQEDSSNVSLQETRHRLFPSDLLGQLAEKPWLINNLIAEYTSRCLPLSSDILSAFLGILSQFKNPHCAISHIWGVPTLWSLDCKCTPIEGFVTGLCWSPYSSHLTRVYEDGRVPLVGRGLGGRCLSRRKVGFIDMDVRRLMGLMFGLRV